MNRRLQQADAGDKQWRFEVFAFAHRHAPHVLRDRVSGTTYRNEINLGPFEPSKYDPAMLELFQAEMDTHIPVLNQGLLAMEKGQAADREIEAMMRAAHSIKGAAKIVGIEPAARISHAMEDCFTAAKDQTVVLSSDAVDVLLQGVDALQRICAPQETSTIDEAILQALLTSMAAVRSGGPVRPPAISGPVPDAVAISNDLIAASIRRELPSVVFPAAIDDVCAATVRLELLDTLSLRPDRIRLDFAHVGQLSAGGLALLVAFHVEVGRTRPAPMIEASGVSPSVRTIFRVAGLARAFGLES